MPDKIRSVLEPIFIQGFTGFNVENSVNMRIRTSDPDLRNGNYAVRLDTWAGSRTISMIGSGVFIDPTYTAVRTKRDYSSIKTIEFDSGRDSTITSNAPTNIL